MRPPARAASKRDRISASARFRRDGATYLGGARARSVGRPPAQGIRAPAPANSAAHTAVETIAARGSRPRRIDDVVGRSRRAHGSTAENPGGGMLSPGCGEWLKLPDLRRSLAEAAISGIRPRVHVRVARFYEKILLQL